MTLPITRQLAWDTLPCDQVERVLASIGLVPPGPEVSEAEHYASHQRLAATAPVEPVIARYAPQLARLIVTASLVEGVETEPEVAEALVAQYAALIAATTKTIVAHLIDEGHLG
ncbi:hypothetical protein [Actinomadura atramentaria]|uniref:hypothetical protein n=1 Tax=Actinomadura atramentaria TaxID=1990 RepID=UPI0012F799C5|nr:hypothetical protein [Actinomadura atramentaria]